MTESSNAVFISYRHDAGGMIAMALFQNLTDYGVDAFYDIENIRAGQFETIILNEIAARPYFVLVLTPGTLERCAERRDWVRREIDHAVATQRMIVPAYTPSFEFADLDQFLPRRIAQAVKGFNGQEVPQKWFKFAVQQLVEEFLLPIEVESVERPPAVAEAVERMREQAQAAPAVTDLQLTAHEYVERGLARRDGDLQGKITDYDEAIRLDPEYATAYYNRGLARANLADLERAIGDFDIAIRFDLTKHATAYLSRGAAHAELGDLARAIADYDQAIRLDPEWALAYFKRGFARRVSGDLEGALADYDEAIRLDPKDASAYNNRGVARGASGNLEGELADYDEAIRLDPEYAVAYVNRGVARGASGNLEGELADYDEAIRLNPRDAAAYHSRGAARRASGDLSGALADCDELIRLDPTNATAHNNRGWARAELGELERATADYDEAIRLDPTYATPYYNRARARSTVDLNGAIADAESATRLAPENAKYRGLVSELRALRS